MDKRSIRNARYAISSNAIMCDKSLIQFHFSHCNKSFLYSKKFLLIEF